MALAEVWVISSGLGRVVPTQIHLGSACGGSLVYRLPQMVLWWEEKRYEENWGEGWGLCQTLLRCGQAFPLSGGISSKLSANWATLLIFCDFLLTFLPDK